MSEKPSEYLKRTCLICGCHTNQTINIYEPRSGPNIVELIQAKFKFQPLNDDKYLCFSCNNWLINWHSLQALNSNDAESPSGTFRSHMNSMVQEKGAGSQQRATGVCRPIAQVKPRQLEKVTPTTMVTAVDTAIPKPIKTTPHNEALNTGSLMEHSNNSNKVDVVAKPKILNYSKRCFRSTKAQRLSRRYARQLKSLQTCCVCGRSIVIRTLSRSSGTLASKSIKKSTTAKCRKCRDVCKWRAVYLNSLPKAERRLFKHAITTSQSHDLVNSNEEQDLGQLAVAAAVTAVQNQSLSFPQPRVDGKVVSMLRRLGTTLSREHSTEAQSITHQYSDEQQQHAQTQNIKLPPIMSPAKQKPRWTRQLESDEILLDFNTAISEVLPLIAERKAIHSAGLAVVGEGGKKQARRMLKYQMTNETLESHELDVKDDNMDAKETEVKAVAIEHASSQQWNPLESFYSGCLPQGLSVSLI